MFDITAEITGGTWFVSVTLTHWQHYSVFTVLFYWHLFAKLNKDIRSTSQKVVISLVVIVLIPPSTMVHRGCRRRVSLPLQRSPITISLQVIPLSSAAVLIMISPSLQTVVQRPPPSSVLRPVCVNIEVIRVKSLGSSPPSGGCGGSILLFSAVLVTI